MQQVASVNYRNAGTRDKPLGLNLQSYWRVLELCFWNNKNLLLSTKIKSLLLGTKLLA